MESTIGYTTLPAPARERGRHDRCRGIPMRRNPFEDTSTKDAWAAGWQEADEEAALLNLAAVAQELLENVTEISTGRYEIEPALMLVFRHAASEAGRFV